MSEMQRHYDSQWPRELFSWVASFFLWARNGSGDVWSRTELFWKPLGKTPLESAEAFRKKGVWVYGVRREIPADVPIAYAGRLDPMAEGLLLFLVGEKCKALKKYTGVDKTYIVEVLLGVSTDTGDLLGKITNSKWQITDTNKGGSSHGGPYLQSAICNLLTTFVGSHKWEYPVFSSKTVGGKPLFRWFYEGNINEIEIPKREISVYSLQLADMYTLTQTELLEQVTNRIARVTKVEDVSKDWGNDFRREEILLRWDEEFRGDAHGREFTVLSLECRCSSGTYMRTLADKIGKELGVPACAFSITRIRIG